MDDCPDDQIEQNQTLKDIEVTIDVLFCIEIIFNFLKTSRNEGISKIATNYIFGTFIFDLISTVPCLLMNEDVRWFGLKFVRVVHFSRITHPLKLILEFALQKYSKKRQNDLTVFASLILLVIFVNHICACVWLHLGKQQPCKD